MSDRQRNGTTHVSLSPWSVTGYLPTARLIHYEDGEHIPVVDFAPESAMQINLGVLSDNEAAWYLDHLATQATRLAEELRA